MDYIYSIWGIIKYFIEIQVRSLVLLFNVIKNSILKPKKYFLGIGYTDAMIQTFYLRQVKFLNKLESRLNNLNYKKVFWYQSKFILTIYKNLNPIKFRLFCHFTILGFFCFLSQNFSLIHLSIGIFIFISPRFITASIMRQNYNYFSFIIFFISIFILFQDPSAINQSKSLILYFLSTLSSFLSITTALLNFLIYSTISLSKILFNNSFPIYFIPHALTIPLIYFIKIISSGTSFLIIERLAQVIGIKRSQKSKLNSNVRPISLNRSLIINSSNIVNSLIIIYCPSINTPYKLLIVCLTLLFIINESYILRFFDTLTIEILSLLVISVCTILINKNIAYNLMIMFISYINLAPLVWTISKLNNKQQAENLSYLDHKKKFINKILYFKESALIHFKEIPKSLKFHEIIELNTFTKEYNRFLNKLSGYKKGRDLKILLITEESKNYNDFLSGCTDFICGLDFIISNDGNSLYPSIYEEWYQGYLYPKITNDFKKQSQFIPKEYDKALIICNDNEITNRLSKSNIEELFVPKDLKMTMPVNTKIFCTNQI